MKNTGLTFIITLALAAASPFMTAADCAFADSAERITLTEALVNRGRLTPSQAHDHIERIVTVIIAELKAGKTVDVEKFGSFSVQRRPLHRGAPGSKQKPTTAKRKYTRFRAADAVRAELNSADR